MRREISYYALGATLYIPIMHQNIKPILKREKYSYLKSVVLCLEDSTALCDMKKGMEILQEVIENLKRTTLKVFIRPRDIENLTTLLTFKNIKVVDGFALSKFDTQNANAYLDIFTIHSHFYIMPILETKEVFSTLKLQLILEKLLPFQKQILVVRVGGEDILGLLGMIRSCHKTLYDVMPLYLIFSNLITLFRPYGFHLSSSVFRCFKESNILHKELLEDIEHQLFNKTSIYPQQVQIIQEHYQVTSDEFQLAKKMLVEQTAIFNHNEVMYEKATHTHWAKTIIARKQYYGVKDEK